MATRQGRHPRGREGRWISARGPSHTPFGGVRILRAHTGAVGPTGPPHQTTHAPTLPQIRDP
eukprot:scaffold4909_cov134-Isochrysis_galbana.AAC.1